MPRKTTEDRLEVPTQGTKLTRFVRTRQQNVARRKRQGRDQSFVSGSTKTMEGGPMAQLKEAAQLVLGRKRLKERKKSLLTRGGRGR